MSDERVAPDPAERLRSTQLPATLCLASLSVVTIVSLCRVFPDWAYLRSMLVVTLGTHVLRCV